MSLSLSNGHARATVLSAVWSPADQQLVAVLMAATDKSVLKALKAELEKNNKNSFVALAGEAQAELAGAKRGYVNLSASLEKVNAQGHVMALLHWRAHDPRSAAGNRLDGPPAREHEFFYVVARHGQCLPSLFLDRLQLALAWALRPEWAARLLELGREAELVDCLPVGTASALRAAQAGQLKETGNPGPLPGFQAALRVIRDENGWGDVIGAALAAGTITLS